MSIAKLRQSFQEEAADMAVTKLISVVKEHPLKGKGNSGTGGDNARYGTVSMTGDKLTLNYNGHPCHAYMRDYRNPVVVYNQYGHRSWINKHADQAWFDFITSDDGPWKEFVGRLVSHVPKDWKGSTEDFIFKNGWVWSDLKNHPSNLQHNFLVATRMGTEWPDSINRWFDLIQEGCHPALAFVFLDVFMQVSGDPKKWQVNNKNKYDWPVDVCTSDETYIRNFCLGKVEVLNKSYADTQVYTPVNRIFGNNGLSSAQDEAYPNRVFELYHDKYGPSKAECDAFWSKKGTGFSKFNYRTHWFVTEGDIIEIIKSETKRLEV